jgi:hypothetical protein
MIDAQCPKCEGMNTEYLDDWDHYSSDWFCRDCKVIYDAEDQTYYSWDVEVI